MNLLQVSFLNLLVIIVTHSTMAQDFPKVPYGTEARQFLDIYLAPSNCPTPVYFDAHGNGGSTNMPNSIINDLKAEGISIVAWESLTSIGTPDEVQTGWDDADLMFEWVKANAAVYNFDTTQWIIGGSSRGSILSWKYGHHPNPNVKGLYMYNALPDRVWMDSTWWYPPNEVNILSPPLFFVYRFEPGVLNDAHDPENGMIIMDKYDALGIGQKDTLIHSIEYSENTDKYQFLVDFARSVTQSCQIVSSQLIENQQVNYTIFPNPFQDQLQISGLKGGEQFTLNTSNGILLGKATNLDLLKVNAIDPGIYFLTIQTADTRKVLKLIKH